MRSVHPTVWLAAALLLSAPAVAEDKASVCADDPRYREFDFWLGSWEVFVDGKKAGENDITKEEGGCLVLERWTDVTGGTGQSYNFYNPQTGKWRQVWVSRTMTIDYTGGLTEGGSMELVGTITYFENGKSLKLLGRWTPQDDGTVRQYFEQYDEAKRQMVPIFTGNYKRKG